MTDLKRLYQSDLPNRAIAVYLYLRGRANKEGFCWPAIPTMARELKMSESTVRRGVRDLELSLIHIFFPDEPRLQCRLKAHRSQS